MNTQNKKGFKVPESPEVDPSRYFNEYEASAWQAALASQARRPEKTISELKEDIFGWAENLGGMDDALAIFAGRVFQSQAQKEHEVKEIPEEIMLLAAVFDAWENGDDCYENGDLDGSYMGKCFRLDDDVFKRCCDLLSRVNPPRNAAHTNEIESLRNRNEMHEEERELIRKALADFKYCAERNRMWSGQKWIYHGYGLEKAYNSSVAMLKKLDVNDLDFPDSKKGY